jgi:hypothetical protein
LGTPGNSAFAGHLQGSGAKGVFSYRSICGSFARLLRLFAAILVSVLSVLAVGQKAIPFRGTLSP